MDSEFKHRARQCCRREYGKVVQRLKRCDTRSQSGRERHFCYRDVARKSGMAARSCIAGLT